MRRRSLIVAVSSALTFAACGLDVVGIAPATDGSGLGGSSVDAKSNHDARSSSDARVEPDLDAKPSGDGNPCAACVGTQTPQSVCVGGTQCVAAYRVFVTSSGSTAKLGGVTGADARCQAFADAANLGGTWKAWLSTGASTKPNSRFTQGTKPYRLLDGTIVANDYLDLTSGSIRAKLQIDETGRNVGNPEAWTGTGANGDNAVTGCGAFTDDDGSAQPATVGVADQTGAQWTDVYLQNCDRTNPRLYCFEQ